MLLPAQFVFYSVVFPKAMRSASVKKVLLLWSLYTGCCVIMPPTLIGVALSDAFI